MDIYHTYCKGNIHYGGEISFLIMKKSTKDLSIEEFFRVRFLFISILVPILQFLTLKANLSNGTFIDS